MFLHAVAIHNKNGQGLLPNKPFKKLLRIFVAIHNKNGQGLLREEEGFGTAYFIESQSTIKMDKGYYVSKPMKSPSTKLVLSQSTIKMDKGYYRGGSKKKNGWITVAIHNKNGQGLLQGLQGN